MSKRVDSIAVMEFINSLLADVNTGDLRSGDLRDAEAKIGKLNLRVVIIHLFGWLKYQHRRRKDDSLRNVGVDWWKHLETLCKTSSIFRSISVLSNEELQFSPELEPPLKLEIRSRVDNDFETPLMT